MPAGDRVLAADRRPGAVGRAIPVQAGDRVKRRGLGGPEEPAGEVVRVFAGLARGIVRVRWLEHGDSAGNLRTSLESTASLEVVQ